MICFSTPKDVKRDKTNAFLINAPGIAGNCDQKCRGVNLPMFYYVLNLNPARLKP